MSSSQGVLVNESKLNDFLGRVIGDFGAGMNAALALIGDKIGLYKAMKELGWCTPGELAERTGTHARYVREWLCAQAAGGYVEYNPVAGKFFLPPEQAFALADESSPCFVLGGFQIIASLIKDEPRLTNAFKSGEGVGWHEHCSELFAGTERFFRPNYNAHLVSQWLPALEGVEQKLKTGARCADVGCGYGASTILMSRAYPKSRFTGFDYHPDSISKARERATEANLDDDQISFEVSPAKNFPGENYDLITFFDCLHDMGDPVGAAMHVKQALKPDGTWMIVEPFAGDKIEDNMNPIGRVFYSASTMICVPASMSQEVGLALGAQAGENALRNVVEQAGFTRFRRAAETPFNLVFEVRP
jgi:ubiquinone/menaquinone biosynthesis C-methylase UbiE